MANTNIFEDDAFASLPSDPYFAAHQLVGIFRTAHSQGKISSNDQNAAYIEAYEMIRQFCADSGVKLNTPRIGLTTNRASNIANIVGYFNNINAELEPEVLARKIQNETIQAQKDAIQRYIAITGKGFVYEFSESDFDQIQKLINHLRELLKKCGELGERHRARLLERLEALQVELHRKMNSFEVIWGYCIEASFAIARIGDAAKEIRETIKQIVSIVTIVSSGAHQLPSNTQPPFQLPAPKEDQPVA